METHCIRDKEVKVSSFNLISPWLIHCHFELPETRELIKCAYMPFSKGERVCLEAGLVIQEALLIITSIVKNFQLEIDGSHIPKPVEQLTIRSANGIKIKFFKRNSLQKWRGNC